MADELEFKVEFVGIAFCAELHIDIRWGSCLDVDWSIRGGDRDACPSGAVDISFVNFTLFKFDWRDRAVSAFPASFANALTI